MEFAQREEAEKKRLEDVEKAHLAEIHGLQVRVIIHVHTYTRTRPQTHTYKEIIKNELSTTGTNTQLCTQGWSWAYSGKLITAVLSKIVPVLQYVI